MSEDQTKNAEQLRLTLLKRRQCQEKALKIVERLIDDSITEDNFKLICEHINNAVYKDLTEERAILLKCGYPLCIKLIKKVPKQKYHISLKHKKVFDISERKNYCSNYCFKASMFLQEQLPTYPLWLLEEEKRPPITFLCNEETKSEGLGQPVELGYSDIQKSKRLQAEISKEVLTTRSARMETSCVSSTVVGSLSRELSELDLADVSLHEIENFQPDTACPSPRPSDGRDGGIVGPAKFSVGPRTRKASANSIAARSPQSSPVEVVERSLGQWVTLETRKFLIDHDCLRRLLPLQGSSDALSDGAVASADPQFWERYEELCRNVDVQELEDSVADKAILNKESAGVLKRKMMAYEQLSEEAKQFKLKINAFYHGKADVVDDDTNVEMLETPKCLTKPVLPLVDSQAQRVLRRRLVLDKINRMCSEVIRTMDLTPRELTSEFRELVHTFDLRANNITFKPAEWTLVILILIKMLGFKDEKIRHSMEKDSFKKLLNVLLHSYRLEIGYLDHITKTLMGF